MNSDGTVKSLKKIAHETNGGPTISDGERLGSAVSSLGDLDGDGVTDLAVGADGDGTGGSDRGAVHVLLLNPDGTAKSSQKIAHQTNGGPTLADRDRFGSAVASLGDLNGDGVTDLAVGAYFDDTGGSDRGARTVPDPGRQRRSRLDVVHAAGPGDQLDQCGQPDLSGHVR